MSIQIDYKYANIISTRLQRYKVKRTNPFLSNFRCPICGDSKRKKSICRGYIYQHKKHNLFMYHCHNCGFHQPMSALIERIDSELYKEYSLEAFLEKKAENVNPISERVTSTTKKSFNIHLTKLTKISKLSHEHPAKKYIDKRKIPPNTHYKLFYTPHFAKWINSIIPDKLYDKQKLDPRLVMPLLDKEGEMFGVQGRDLTGKSQTRYITIMFDESKPKIYGLENFDPNYSGYIVEGPIDSLFLPNCLAMAGSDVPINILYDTAHIIDENITWVIDNQPRNKEVVSKIEKLIEDGKRVCIWPSSLLEKDINDLVIAGKDSKSIIDKHTYTGLRAKLAFALWRRDNGDKNEF